MKDIFRWVLDKRDEQTLELIAQIKRFNECLVGDIQFRQHLIQDSGDVREIVREKGIKLDPYALRPIWENGRGLRESLSKEDLKEYPLLQIWADWINDLRRFRSLLRKLGEDECPESRFLLWRRRQMARSDSQLGDLDKAITHPAVTFELSKGCSRGCWFCGLSAESFEGYLPYTEENRQLWRGVLTAFRNVFGGLLQTGFCYWATEPADNRDYLDFIKDFYDISGIFPQTTTSAPLKDPAWTRELLKLHAHHRSIPCRFSVLSVETLRKIHQEFSPREILTTELVIQTKDGVLPKARAGRMRLHNHEKDKANNEKDMGTIACVSGFLVNMIDKKLQLISPCAASERWPLGYRIHATESFRDATDFHEKLLKITESCMSIEALNNRPVSFRNDLEYEALPEGFTVKNRFKKYTFKGRKLWRVLGELVYEGQYNRSDLIDRLVDEEIDFFSAIGALDSLYDKGLIEDEPVKNIS